MVWGKGQERSIIKNLGPPMQTEGGTGETTWALGGFSLLSWFLITLWTLELYSLEHVTFPTSLFSYFSNESNNWTYSYTGKPLALRMHSGNISSCATLCLLSSQSPSRSSLLPVIPPSSSTSPHSDGRGWKHTWWENPLFHINPDM